MLDFNQPAPAGEVHHPLSSQLSRLRDAFGSDAE
jgi:hypothetical protein